MNINIGEIFFHLDDRVSDLVKRRHEVFECRLKRDFFLYFILFIELVIFFRLIFSFFLMYINKIMVIIGVVV